MKNMNMLSVAKAQELVCKTMYAFCGVYNLRISDVVDVWEGEADEWSVQPSHSFEGDEGIALIHSVYDEEIEQWFTEPAIFWWLPKEYHIFEDNGVPRIKR